MDVSKGVFISGASVFLSEGKGLARISVRACLRAECAPALPACGTAAVPVSVFRGRVGLAGRVLTPLL